jgi:hypothetical protein
MWQFGTYLNNDIVYNGHIFHGMWLVHVDESHAGYLHFMQALLISCHCLCMHRVAHVLVTYLQSGEGAQIGGVFDADIGVSAPCRTVRVWLGCLLHPGWHVAYFQLILVPLTDKPVGRPTCARSTFRRSCDNDVHAKTERILQELSDVGRRSSYSWRLRLRSGRYRASAEHVHYA